MFNEKARKLLGTRYTIGKRLPILTVGALIADDRYRHYLAELKTLSNLPGDHFRVFYRHVVEHFAEFVQLFPGDINAPLGYLLETGLLRGINVLHSFVNGSEGVASPLERYALFTAYLVRDIAQVVVRQKILVTDSQGSTMRIWQPFSGSLVEEVNQHPLYDSYKIMPLAIAYEEMNPEIRIILARQVMGELGFSWIASDLRLFKDWLEALTEDDEGGIGRLVCVYKRYREAEGKNFMETLSVGTDVTLLDSPATQHADDFYIWLNEGLAAGRIKMNTANAPVHITSKGVFIHTPEVLKTFVQQKLGGAVPETVVAKQLNYLLGITASKGNPSYVHTQVLTAGHAAGNGTGGLKSGFTGLSAEKRVAVLHGVLIKEANSLYLMHKALDASQHVKLSAAIEKEHEALAEFNESMKTSLTMRKS